MNYHSQTETYCEAAREVQHAGHSDIRQALVLFFNVIDNLPLYKAVVEDLPTIDLNRLLKDARAQRESGFPWPPDLDSMLAVRWEICLATSTGELVPWEFMFDYYADTSRHLDTLVRAFVSKIFLPMSDAIKKRARTCAVDKDAVMPQEARMSTMNKRVFVSHCSADTDLARTLVALLVSACRIEHEDIRCTSVDGYSLEAGVITDSVLKREAVESGCFIGLLTPDSLKSTYVIFELGARWGSGRKMIPLVAHGLKKGSLPKPLDAINAKDAAVRSDLLDAVDAVAQALGVEKRQFSLWDGDLASAVEKAAGSRSRAEADPTDQDELPGALL